MVPMSIFRSAQFSATNVVTFLLYGAFAAALFMLGLVLQGPLGYSPLLAGAAIVPLTIMMLLFSARAGALAQTHRPTYPDDAWTAVVRMRVCPADPCRAGTQLRRRRAPGHPRVLSRFDADRGAADDHGVELGVVAPRRYRIGINDAIGRAPAASSPWPPSPSSPDSPLVPPWTTTPCSTATRRCCGRAPALASPPRSFPRCGSGPPGTPRAADRSAALPLRVDRSAGGRRSGRRPHRPEHCRSTGVAGA